MGVIISSGVGSPRAESLICTSGAIHKVFFSGVSDTDATVSYYKLIIYKLYPVQFVSTHLAILYQYGQKFHAMIASVSSSHKAKIYETKHTPFIEN